MRKTGSGVELALAIAIVLGVVQSARAEDYDPDGNWYVGAGAGRSVSKLHDSQIATELDAPGFTTTSVTTDSHKNAWKLFSGYQFNNNFALEGSYFNLGKFRFYAPTAPAGRLDGSIEVRGFALDAVGSLPFTDKFSAFAKIGVTDAQTRDSFSATGGNLVAEPVRRKWHVNSKYGAGLQYLFTRNFGLRGEWERYHIADGVRDRGNVDAWFVSVVFPFGEAPPPPPAHVQPAPPPAPQPPPPLVVQPAAPAVAPVPRHVTFDADALFAFNSADVRSSGKTALDAFAERLRSTRFDQVRVTGHTDRIGSDAYNMRLSKQRADAVRDYLVASGSVDASKIVAEGKGKSEPVTKPGQCGAGRSRAVIDCLQPDRRVELEVSGTEK